MERAAQDFLATLIFDRLFERFPRLRVASVENGSGFLPDLFRKLESAGKKSRGHFKEDPVETFKRHVWINPFWEDDVHEILEFMGSERVIFGSDWPHMEGMEHPQDIFGDLDGVDLAQSLLLARSSPSSSSSSAVRQSRRALNVETSEPILRICNSQ